MKKTLLLLLSVLGFHSEVLAQAASHRMLFHYRLTQEKLDKIGNANNSYPLYLTNGTSPGNYKLCSDETVLKVGITNTAGKLSIDPWFILDYRVNKFIADEIAAVADPTKKAELKAKYTDPCYSVDDGASLPAGNFKVVNAGTKKGLEINLPERPLLGSPVTGLTLPYRAIIVSINTIPFKTRPRVKDYKGNNINSAISAGTFNLGLNVGYSVGQTAFTPLSSNNISLTGGFGLGLSALKLKDEPLTREVDVAVLPSNFVLSPAGTLILARNDIGFILACGVDHMTGNEASAWAYQNKFFFGFGIAAGFKL